jgi:hypothetical protein
VTVEELKIEAAKLPNEERLDLAGDGEVRKARHGRLQHEIQVGIDQIDRGHFVELHGEGQLQEFFEQIRTQGRERLAARKKLAE